MKKIEKVNGLVIAELNTKEQADSGEEQFAVFTKDEWSQPAGFRYPEISTNVLQHARDFAASY